MTKLEKIERDFRALSQEEQRQFIDMIFASRDEDDEWDRQMKSDDKTGKLDGLIAEARADIAAGRVKPL